ncbi:MAG TPA: Mur ligase family protein [bacterium]|nr:Mur ligase family protein [bacterium]
MKYRSLHFTGIGGSGMSALAQVVRSQGVAISGSDRLFDRDPERTRTLATIFRNQAITIFPQDGSGISDKLSALVVSTAIEDSNPDVREAKKIGIEIITRAQLLSYIFNKGYGVAIGGTSGKSTIAAMVAYILLHNGRDPVYIGGGIIRDISTGDSQLSNALCGRSDVICVETDESDGSIVLYKPKISVLANISKDHKDIPELEQLFNTFLKNTQETAILNNDCPMVRKLPHPSARIVTYGIDNDADLRARDIVLSRYGATFTVEDDTRFSIKLIGMHNVSNALAAIAVSAQLGVPPPGISDALSRFPGIKRRLELVGESRGVAVYDDFAHNPAKVQAALGALRGHHRRIIAVFQPHGYGPMHLMKDDFVEAFCGSLRPDDTIIMPEIYDAGGTADRTISSKQVIDAVAAKGIAADYITSREAIAERIAETAQDGDAVVVMGARDTTLSLFCQDILRTLGQR